MKALFEYVQETARLHPEKLALSDDGSELTYAQLDSLSDAVASSLSKFVHKGDVIGVYLPYGKGIVVSTLAIIKVGGVYLPLDPSYPKERLLYMIGDSGAKAILTTEDFYSQNPLGVSLPLFYIDQQKKGSSFVGKSNPSSFEPALILYTSGTTGKPKGVVHSHTMMVSFGNYRSDLGDGQISPKSKVAVLTGFTFIGTNDFMFSTLKEGGSLFFAPNEAKKDLAALVNFVKEKGITHIFLPSSLAALMVELYDTGSLHIFAAGEKLRRFTPLSKETKVYNAYGCTETCGIFATEVSGKEETMPLGKLAKDTTALLVDEDGKEVRNGEKGELWVNNARMSHGYLNLEKLNEEKWIKRDGKTFFKTGDRVYLGDDGNYYYVGRIDNMVKLRGFRIETGEVENQVEKAINRLGIAAKSPTVVLKNVNGIDRLCCYYEAEKPFDENKVKEEIRKALADYMLPDLWVALVSLPRNPNGKVSRSELPEPQMEKGEDGEIRNEIEAKLSSVVKEAMRLPSVDLSRSFVDYGGDSIQAMRISSLLRENGILAKGSDLLTSPSLREIANNSEVNYLLFWSEEERKEIEAEFRRRGETIEEVLPFDQRQRNLSLDMLLHPDMTDVKKVIVLQIDSLISQKSLQKAIEIASVHHKELRSTYVFKNVSASRLVITSKRINVRFKGEASDEEVMQIYDNLLSESSEESSLFDVTLIHSSSSSLIYLSVHKLIYSRPLLRGAIKDIMASLHEDYEKDSSISGWLEILDLDIPEIRKIDEQPASISLLKKKEKWEDVHFFARGEKTIYFVHTGNSGSDAYYHFAEKIKGKYGFAVFEPFNLYHPKDATYGIKNIASRYIATLKKYQPKGPYILGGWCYGGVVAHEMAHQLEKEGEEVELLIMFDSHAVTKASLQKDFASANSSMNREYFLTSPLFADIRAQGMLEDLIRNASHVYLDLKSHIPSLYEGKVLYFKPDVIPSGILNKSKAYWRGVLKLKAGNFEHYCVKDKLRVILTPDEHDLMMKDSTLDIAIPAIEEELGD